MQCCWPSAFVCARARNDSHGIDDITEVPAGDGYAELIACLRVLALLTAIGRATGFRLGRHFRADSTGKLFAVDPRQVPVFSFSAVYWLTSGSLLAALRSLSGLACLFEVTADAVVYFSELPKFDDTRVVFEGVDFDGTVAPRSGPTLRG